LVRLFYKNGKKKSTISKKIYKLQLILISKKINVPKKNKKRKTKHMINFVEINFIIKYKATLDQKIIKGHF
jgi:hypothetical protein